MFDSSKWAERKKPTPKASHGSRLLSAAASAIRPSHAKIEIPTVGGFQKCVGVGQLSTNGVADVALGISRWRT